jgi:hypothetical protein
MDGKELCLTEALNKRTSGPRAERLAEGEGSGLGSARQGFKLAPVLGYQPVKQGEGLLRAPALQTRLDSVSERGFQSFQEIFSHNFYEFYNRIFFSSNFSKRPDSSLKSSAP